MIEAEVDPSRFWWRKRTVWAGAALSAAAAAESFGPSLMPRGGHHQALVAGASGLAGWIAGVIAAGRLTRSPSAERNLVTSARAKSQESRAKSQEPRAKSQEPKVKGQESRAGQEPIS